jgi:CPA2 family monovalent cation:H+ antiporter-2
MERSDDPLAELPMTVDLNKLTGHVLLVGYGRVGSRLAEALTAKGIPIVVAEQNRELVESLRARGTPAVSGDAAEPAVLIQAHVARAGILAITVPDTLRSRKMVEIARALKPDIEILARAHSDEEVALLKKDGIGSVFMGEHELARAMIKHVFERLKS